MKKFLSTSALTVCKVLAVLAVMSIANPHAGAETKESLIQKRKTELEHRYAGKTTVVEKMFAGRGLRKAKTVARPAGQAAAPLYRTAAGDELMGFLMSDNTEDYMPGIVSIALEDGLTTLVHESELHIAAGACVLNELYLETYSSYTLYPTGLYAKNIDTGEERLVAAYGEADPMFYDMTYDENAGVMYAVGGTATDELMSIYTVSPSTGAYEKLFELDCFLFTLAVGPDGMLYGIDDVGYLYHISVDSQSWEFVDWTGYFPAYMQSMTYNTTDDMLYWAAFTDEGYSSLVKVDPQFAYSEVVAETLGYNAEIGALFFRPDASSLAVPAAPTDFDVIVGGNGANKATLVWANPATTVGGEPLSAIVRVEVYRNGVVVHEIENPKVGGLVTWADEDVPTGMTTYGVLAVNESGSGRMAESAAVFVGRDVPGQVRNLLLTKEEDSYVTNLTWEAPVMGKHNGWFDASSLKYNVVRYPDGKVMAENLTSCAYTDATITETSGYSYGVVALNNDGAGDTLRSNVLIIGPALDVPYACSFETEEERNMWIIDDANSDGYTWYYDHNWGGDPSWFMYYYYNDQEPVAADDWFFSAPIRFEAGKHYMLSYDVRIGLGGIYHEKYRVALCDGMTPSSVVQEIDNRTDYGGDFVFKTASVAFVPETSGEFSLGFQVYSDANNFFVHITHISVKEVPEVDMSVDAIHGMDVAVYNEEVTYEVTVTNNGANLMSNFVVNVADAAGKVYGTVDVKYDLDVNASLIVPVTCRIPSEAASVELVAEVVAEGDAVADNNKSAPREVEILQESQYYDIVKIGDNQRRVSGFVPFDLHTTYSVVQMLFTPEMLGFTGTTIERIGYNYYVQQGEYAKNVKVKIYMCNVSDLGSLTGWLDPSMFTLVYDGEISLDEDNNAQMLVLDVPFVYEGDELAVMTETDGGGEAYYYNWFYASTQSSEDNFYSMSWSNDVNDFDLTVTGMESPIYPNFTFVLNSKDASVGNIAADTYRVNTLADRYIYITGAYDEAYLYSVDGMLLQQSRGEETMQVGSYRPGIYLLKVSAGGAVRTHKIVINH